MPNEDYALVLDFLPRGKANSYKSEPVAQVIGTRFFTLLEITPKAGTEFRILEKIYVGRDQREKVEFIKGRVSYMELTSNSVAELDKAIDKIVSEDEPRFVEFFNKATAITIKRHQLELLPGLGKKHLFDILGQRQQKPFESFADLEQRVKLMPNPRQTIAKRVIEELMAASERHYLFARPPSEENSEKHFRGFRK